MNEYLTNSLAWSFVGIFPGVVLGYAMTKLEEKFPHRRHHDHT